MIIAIAAPMFDSMIAMLVALGCVLAADQVSKLIVSTRMSEGASSPALLGLRFTHVMNRRRPWNSTSAVRIMTLILICLTLSAVVAAEKINSTSTNVAIGAIAGGAAGNLVDGFNRHAVVDFIDLRLWPVFNIADAAIASGAAWMLFTVIR